MFQRKKQDVVVEITSVPGASIGSPIPIVLSNEYMLILAYNTQDGSHGIDDGSGITIDESSTRTSMAIVHFKIFVSYQFGPPNNHTCSQHPLAKAGLHPYGIFRVDGSSWIRTIQKMDSASPYYDADRYDRLRHFIFTFQMITLECIAEDFEVSIEEGRRAEILTKMTKLLDL